MKINNKIVLTPALVFAAGKLPEQDGREVVLEEYSQSLEEQGYQRRCAANGEIVLTAADEAGMMYALLDLAEELKLGMVPSDCQKVPHLKNRGIKFNIPLDARTPSYSDASTSATKNIPQMWELSFWHSFLDRMAEEKYNVLSLWSLSPFPSLVRIPEFPKACIEDVKITTKPFHARLSGRGIYGEGHRKSLITVKRMTIDDKIAFWRSVMEYAKDRCIRIFVFTWNVFAYGTEDSGYGITEDQNNPVTREYFYYGTKALMDTYPLLAGIGVTAGENMTFNGKSTDDASSFSATDVGFIAETYGRAVADYLKEHPERDFTLIHRMQMARYDKIMEAYTEFPGKFEISFKYSQAHMYSSTKPRFIQDFLEEKNPDTKIWLTVRNDDYYMCRWGDPEFAREYLCNMPVDCMNGFYMGPDGFTWGRDYMTVGDEEHPLVVDKMWYMFKIWGQLSYDPELQEEYFIREVCAHFQLDRAKGETVYRAWRAASQVLPGFQCMHWHDFDFQWYPEGCCMYDNGEEDKIWFADIHEFMECPAIPKGDHASVQEYADSVAEGTALEKISPVDVVRSMEEHISEAEGLLKELNAEPEQVELARTLYDINLMCCLGSYFAWKERAAMNLAVYQRDQKEARKQEAIEQLKKAAAIWKDYSAKVNAAYIPQVLTRLCGKINVQEFDEIAALDVLLAKEM